MPGPFQLLHRWVYAWDPDQLAFEIKTDSGSSRLRETGATIRPLDSLQWFGYSTSLTGLIVTQWCAAWAKDMDVSLSCDTIFGVLDAARKYMVEDGFH